MAAERAVHDTELGELPRVKSQVLTAYDRELLSNVRKRPRTYLLDGSFVAHTAFITGLEAGAGWMPLRGFREFLLAKIGTESSLAWPGLVPWLVEPIGHKDVSFRGLGDDLDAAATTRLNELLDEFLAIREARDGLTQIFGEYLAVPPTPWLQLRRHAGSRTSRGCTSSPQQL